MSIEHMTEYASEDGVPLPAHLFEGLKAYEMFGVPTGGFIEAVLSNDLREAMGQADRESLKHLHTLFLLIYNYCPHTCWGSEKRVNEWLQAKREERAG